MTKTFLVVTVLLLTATNAFAQEVQVPVDTEGKVEYIDADLEKKLKLFPDVIGFEEARLFQISDTNYVLEISYREENRLLKKKQYMTDAEVLTFRQSVTTAIAERAPEKALNQEGRTLLLVGTTLLSLGYYGWAVPVALETDDARTFVALYLLTSAGGFFIPLSVTRNINVTDASTSLTLHGATRGIVHGIHLNSLLWGEEATARGAIALGMLMSIGEGLAGFVIADKLQMSAGHASLIGVMGDFGYYYGLATWGLLEGETGRSLSALVLPASGLGLFAGHWLAVQQSYSSGDAYILRTAGIVGSYLPVAFLGTLGVEGGKTYIISAMLGATLGIAAGHHLTSKHDFTTGQGVLISLGTFGGWLTGLGIAFLTGSTNEKPYFVLSSLGAVGGFFFLYKGYADEARASQQNSGWNFQIFPQGFAAAALQSRYNNSFNARIPMISVGYRF